MIPDIAKNKIRDVIKNELATGLVGTDGTDPVVSNTDLGTPDLTTSNSVDSTVANKTINTTHILFSNQGNGSIYKELGLKFTDGTLYNRVVFPDFSKNSDVELHTTIISRVN